MVSNPDRPFRANLYGLGFFCCLLGWNIWFHGAWADETQAWGLVRSSTSLVDLYHRLECEGHPMLWHLLLYPFTRMSGEPGVMQGVNGALTCATLTLLWLRSPFKLHEKLLLSSGFPLVFEYGVVARCYGLGFLLMLLFVHFRDRWKTRPWQGWFLLGLVANCHLFFVLSSLVLAGLWIKAEGKTIRSGFPLYPVMIFFSGLTMLRADSTTALENAWDFSWSSRRFCHKFGAFGNGFLPLEDLTNPAYWNPHFPGVLALVMGSLALLLIVFYLKPQPLALAGVLIQGFVTFFFFYFRYGGYSWHANVLVVTFIAVVWWLRERGARLGHPAFLLIILSCCSFAGVKATVLSKISPVSAVREAALWIEDQGLEKEFWFGYPIFPTLGVANYLQRPIYSIEMGEPTFYTHWGQSRRLEWREVVPAFLQVMRDRDLRVAFWVTEKDASYHLYNRIRALHRNFRVRKLWERRGCAKEDITIYRLELRTHHLPPESSHPEGLGS